MIVVTGSYSCWLWFNSTQLINFRRWKFERGWYLNDKYRNDVNDFYLSLHRSPGLWTLKFQSLRTTFWVQNFYIYYRTLCTSVVNRSYVFFFDKLRHLTIRCNLYWQQVQKVHNSTQRFVIFPLYSWPGHRYFDCRLILFLYAVSRVRSSHNVLYYLLHYYVRVIKL